jgi:DNA-binding SARP family transcriptional activator
MELRTLGSLEVSAHGAPLSVGGPSEQRQVLAALLLDVDRVV